MEIASPQILATATNKPVKSPTETTTQARSEKKRKCKFQKDPLSFNQRRSKRRRTIASGDDFNVNFSKIKVCESNRVLRSNTRRSHSSSFEALCDTQNCSQSDAVSKDHSYSKASKHVTKQKDHTINPPTVHLKVFIDLTSSEENSFDHLVDASKDSDPLLISQTYYRRNNKIEIIDFDDLELSNSCYEDHGAKCDHNFNDPSVENKNLSIPIAEPTEIFTVSDEDRDTVENYDKSPGNKEIFEKSNDQEAALTEDSDQNFNPKTDFEKLLAKYGDADLYLTRNTSFLEHSHWMLESAINPGSFIEKPQLGNEDSSQSPIYLDLDQNRVRVSSPQRLATIGQPEMVSIAGPMNFSSGGSFQRLGAVVTSTVTRPVISESEHDDGTPANCLLPKMLNSYSNVYEPLGVMKPTSIGRSSPNESPDFQAVFAHKIASLIRTKPGPSQPATDSIQGHHPNGILNSTTAAIASNFSTSGGSIERIFSPVIPKQPSSLNKYPGIAIPFEGRASSTPRLVPELAHYDSQNGQQPECRIHLVDTPPSFTRTSQPEAISNMPIPQSTGTQNFMISQQARSESSRMNGSQLKTQNKPKRIRRTRAQMEIYRQEMSGTCNHRNKRSQRFAAKTSSHIVGRNFSMEYRRVHSHPQELLYGGLPTRFSPYIRPQAQRYSETYSVNETNLFGVSSNSSEWSQSFEPLSNFSHGITELRSFEPLWALNSGMRNLNSFATTETGLRMNTGEEYEEYHEPSMGSFQNPSSVMWNQQLRSVQLQSAYGNVHQVPMGNSRHLSAGRRPFTPWHQPLNTSVEHLTSNLTDVATSGPLEQMQFY